MENLDFADKVRQEVYGFTITYRKMFNNDKKYKKMLLKLEIIVSI